MMNKVKYGADAQTLRCAACFACWTSANALCSPSHTAPSGRKSGFPSHCISDLHGRIQKPHATLLLNWNTHYGLSLWCSKLRWSGGHLFHQTPTFFFSQRFHFSWRNLGSWCRVVFMLQHSRSSIYAPDLSVLDDSRVSRERTLGLMSGSCHALAIAERIIFLISLWAESEDGVQLLSGIHAVVISGRLLVQIPDQTESQNWGMSAGLICDQITTYQRNKIYLPDEILYVSIEMFVICQVVPSHPKKEKSDPFIFQWCSDS